jgi:uncharacterized cupin superfamily protein
MYKANLNTLDLFEAWYENDPQMRIKAFPPFSKATGNASSAIMYFEIEPGHYLGTHTDSAEEIVLLLSGTVEASLGDEHGALTASAMWGRRRRGVLASSRRRRWSQPLISP